MWKEDFGLYSKPVRYDHMSEYIQNRMKLGILNECPLQNWIHTCWCGEMLRPFEVTGVFCVVWWESRKKTNFELVLKYLRSESFHDAKQVIWWHSVWTTREINSFPFMGSSVRFQDKDHEYNKDGDRATKNIIAIFF